MKLSFGRNNKRMQVFPQKLESLKVFIEKSFEEPEGCYSSLLEQEPPHLSFHGVKLFYVDSEDEKIAISEDEDLKEAFKYRQLKNMNVLKVYIVKKEHIQQIVEEIKPQVQAIQPIPKISDEINQIIPQQLQKQSPPRKLEPEQEIIQPVIKVKEEKKVRVKKEKKVKVAAKPKVPKYLDQMMRQSIRQFIKSSLIGGIEKESLRQSQLIKIQESQVNQQIASQMQISQFEQEKDVSEIIEEEPEQVPHMVVLEEIKQEEKIEPESNANEVNEEFSLRNQGLSDDTFLNESPSRIMKLKFKNKMASTKAMQDLISQGKLGQEITLRFMITNNCKKPWPAKPLLQNFSKDHDNNIIEIDAILQPKEQYELVYRLRLPEFFSDRLYTLNLQLVDPIKNERFGEPMLALIEVEQDNFKEEQSILMGTEEEQKSLEIEDDYHNQESDSRKAIGQQCLNVVHYIDDILNQQNDDFNYQNDDLKHYHSLHSQNDEELQSIREKAEMEKEQSLKQFYQLRDESVSDMMMDREIHQLDNEERLKIEKAKKLFQYDMDKRFNGGNNIQ